MGFMETADLNSNEVKYKCRKVVPEGGFGYFVAFGLGVVLSLGFGIFPSFSFLYGDFLKNIGAESSAVSVIMSAFFFALSIAGLFTNTLIKKSSLRSVGLFGAVLYISGSFMSIFVSSVAELVFSFGILQGLGFGFSMPVVFATFNSYFVERRVLMMSLAQTIIGLVTMIYPILIQKLLEMYGFRGTIALIAVINTHALVGMLLMHPVKWHMKIEKFVESSEMISLNVEQNKEPVKLKAQLMEVVQPLTNSCWETVVDFLDLKLLKDFTYVNIAFGISLVNYSDVAFFTFQPLYLFNIGYVSEEIAYIIAIGASADLISRFFLVGFSACFKVKARYIYFVGVVLTIFSRIAFVYAEEFTSIAVITAIMGFLRTLIHIPLSLTFAEYLPQNRFASGYGLYMFLQGIIMFLVAPAIGYVRDYTSSYLIAFHCLTGLLFCCLVPWIFEFLFKRKRIYQKS